MMNRIQRLSLAIETGRLKLQMGLGPEVDIDALTLRTMWRQLCQERGADEAGGIEPRGLSGPLST